MRGRPLRVQGVGNGAQICNYDCTLPIALKQKDKSVALGQLVTPTVSGSDLPGLLGFAALPGDYDLAKATPPGTDTFQLELAPSGHMVLPCCEFPSSSNQANPEEYTLTLMSRTNQQKDGRVPPAPQQPPQLPQLMNESAVPPPPGSETH